MSNYDPYTKLELYLWSLLDLSPEVTARCKPGNRVKYCDTTKPDPLAKAELLRADLPELELRPIGIRAIPSNTSASMSEEVAFRLFVQTGQMRTNGDGSTITQSGVHPLMWHCKSAFVRAMDGNQMRFKAPSVPFLRKLRVQAIDQNREKGTDQNKPPDGWTAVLDIVAECHFSLINDIGGFRGV